MPFYHMMGRDNCVKIRSLTPCVPQEETSVGILTKKCLAPHNLSLWFPTALEISAK